MFSFKSMMVGLALFCGAGAVFAQEEVIDLNSASAEQLMTLKGVGRKRAEEIVALRVSKGCFASVDDLKEVKGVGEKTLEHWRPFVKTSECSAAPQAEKPAEKNPGKPAAAPKAELPEAGALLDINRASAEELVTIKGIGPKKAEEIVTLRASKGCFGSIDELKEIKGIGDKAIEKIRPYLKAGDCKNGVSEDAIDLSKPAKK